MPVSLDDRFHLGSNTKSMTATRAGILVEEGRLGWGSTVGEVLGREVPGLSASLAGATLAQLLSHASGIPGDTEDMLALYFNGNPFDYNPPALRLRPLAAWKHHVVTVPEGSPFHYSNFGYKNAGSMIEKVAGTPWEQLMDDRIFVPMGMPTARLGPPGMPICRSAITPNGPVGTPARAGADRRWSSRKRCATSSRSMSRRRCAAIRRRARRRPVGTGWAGASCRINGRPGRCSRITAPTV
jgi:CubicO group peptidase (beta-lactamase class C family)